MLASGHQNESSIISYACGLKETKTRYMSDCLIPALRTVNKNPTESNIYQEKSFASLKQEDLDAVFKDSAYEEEEISSSSCSFNVH